MPRSRSPESPDTPSAPARVLRLAGRAGLLLLVLYALAFGERFVSNVAEGGTALSDYLAAGSAVRSGELYELNYAYPPAFAVGMLLLALLPQPVAATL